MEEEEQEDQNRVQTQTLALFDLLWSRHLILLDLPPPPPPPVPPSSLPLTKLHRQRSAHRRSKSDDLSPTLKIQTPKLQTILSGKESMNCFDVRSDKDRGWRKQRERRRRTTREENNSKSLSDLEFEELKGLMDLGFTFSDADSDPRLREIVPGLQRLNLKATRGDQDVPEGSSCASLSADAAAVARPYLSEAWDVEEREEEGRMRRKFGIKIGGNEVDLKDQLRFWAQAVASTVR